MNHGKCHACGDCGPLVHKYYCLECAAELYEGQINTEPAKLHFFGGRKGCPLEPNNDASPGQENAIRYMEE